jgi:hypothetical protein
MHWVQTVDLEEKAKPCKQNLQTTEAAVFCSWYLPLLHVVHVVVGVAKDVAGNHNRSQMAVTKILEAGALPIIWGVTILYLFQFLGHMRDMVLLL